MIATFLDRASHRCTVLLADMASSLQIERSGSPHAMRSQILFQIARVSIVGRPGCRFVARIAVGIVAADRLPGNAIKRCFAHARVWARLAL